MWRRSFSKFAIRASGLGFLTRSFSRVAGKRFAALWGNGDYGRLGLGNLDSQWKPVVSTAFRNQNLKAIACGGAHTLFLKDYGCVYATGLNDFGQLGVSESKHYSVVWSFAREVTTSENWNGFGAMREKEKLKREMTLDKN